MLTEHLRHHARPRDVAQVGIGAFVADEILFAFEDVVENHGYADNLLFIPFPCRVDLLLMEMVEPSGK